MKPADATQMRATNVRQRTVADVIISPSLEYSLYMADYYY
jgi:hypothetical protein